MMKYFFEKWLPVAGHIAGGAIAGAAVGYLDPDRTLWEGVTFGVFVWSAIAVFSVRAPTYIVLPETSVIVRGRGRDETAS